MAEKTKSLIAESAGKMTHLCRKVIKLKINWSLLAKFSAFPRFFRFIWNRVLACSIGKHQYHRISHRSSPSTPSPEMVEAGDVVRPRTTSFSCGGYETDSDLVSLKISLLGDCQIGKTSFVIKYVGDEQENRGLEMEGLNLVDKIVVVQGARIAFTIWDVAGDSRAFDQVPMACKDAVAIMFMFDLTSRCTLQSVIGWYKQARKYNQTAIPVLIGAKFDEFVKLPPNLQWTIITQARTYARAMNATLFFSSATHNINVNKIFKFVMAKLFNLPWKVERNLTLGEPIIDFQ
uniref:Septum-promoting GTP-binding protein 1 n=1 Tax=Kalanchoe fedtschenkoi TaxID=63787 RepID=A0A7N0UPU1_KALFE